MIKLKEIYTFQEPYIAAASGLVLAQNRFYLVADDELSLLGINRDLSGAQLHEVFQGELPEDTKERKKIKQDFECLLFLEDKNTLVIIPSGSKKNRNRGALYNLNDHLVTEISFKLVYQELELLFPELNIEGAVVLNNSISLFQRGNGKLHQNAVIQLNLESFLADKVKDLKVQNIDLGRLKDIPLSFTDAALFNGQCYFVAVAENTESTYTDGEFIGAVLGELSPGGEVLKMTPLDINSKPEGLTFDNEYFYLVTDDDDRKKPSRLFRGALGQ